MNLRFRVLLSLVACACLLPACRRKREEAPAVMVPASEVAASVGVQTAELPSQKVIYEAISKYMAANGGRAAKDVNELVQKGFLKALPALPPGKRYELDQRSAVLAIVDN